MSISALTLLTLTSSMLVFKLAIMALVVVMASKTLFASKPFLFAPNASKLAYTNKSQTHA